METELLVLLLLILIAQVLLIAISVASGTFVLDILSNIGEIERMIARRMVDIGEGIDHHE